MSDPFVEAIIVSDIPAPDPVVCACAGCDIQSIRADLDNVLTIVKAIQEEVGPTLDSLKSNPMLKMFFGGK